MYKYRLVVWAVYALVWLVVALVGQDLNGDGLLTHPLENFLILALVAVVTSPVVLLFTARDQFLEPQSPLLFWLR